MSQSPLHDEELADALKSALSSHEKVVSSLQGTTDHLRDYLTAMRAVRKWIVQPRTDAIGRFTQRQTQLLIQLDTALQQMELTSTALISHASDVLNSSSTRVWLESTIVQTTE